MATKTQTTIVAVFRNTAEAEAAAEELQGLGVHRDRILVTSTNAANTYQPLSATGTGYREGGIKGWWHSMFGGDDENAYDRDRYENAVNQGNVLLSVDTVDQDEDRIADLINRHSPINIHEEPSNSATTRATNESLGNSIATHITTPEETPASEPPAPGSTATAKSSLRTRSEARTPSGNAPANTGAAANPQAIPVVEEELKVGKRRVLRGGVRVYSRVIEQPVEESIGLQEEHVRVERQKVDRPATNTDLRPGQEKVIEVKEFSEEPVVSKETRVVEEVRVNKEATQRTETVRDKVRRTEVDVQPIQGRQNVPDSAAELTSNLDADSDAAFRRDYETNYSSSGQPYEYYAGAYGFGYTIANDPRFRNRRFEDVERDLRTDYEGRYPNSTWDRVKNSVRYGWNRLRNRV